MAPVNMLNLNSDELKEFLHSFDHIFSDCDGVVWTPESALPGVGEFFSLMKRHGKTVHFVSNNSLRSRKQYEDMFRSIGIEYGAENLTIPSIIVAEYLKSINFDKKVYCVTTQEAVHVLQSYGLKCEYGPNVIEVNNYQTDFLPYMEDDEDIGAVYFDSDLGINFAKLYRATTYLRRPDVLFLAGAHDKSFILKQGRFDIAPGEFIALVERKVNRKVVLMGKPTKVCGQFVMKRAGVTDPSRVLFIGDMIEQDVGVGKATGFKTLLLLTNIPEEEMMASPLQPDYYAPSLESLVSKFEKKSI